MLVIQQHKQHWIIISVYILLHISSNVTKYLTVQYIAVCTCFEIIYLCVWMMYISWESR